MRLFPAAALAAIAAASCGHGRNGRQGEAGEGAAAASGTARAGMEGGRRGYAAALARGRRLERAKDLAGAVRAFRRALSVRPGDPVALSELGFAEYRAGDLRAAEIATARSVALADDPHVQAASLYNLGLIQERESRGNDAVWSYERSFVLRPNGAVLARLAALDTAAASRVEPLLPRRMRGPFASLDAYCAGEHVACLGRRAAIGTPPAAYSAIEVDEISRGAESGPGGAYILALHRPAGWFVGDLATFTPGSRFAVPVLETRRLTGAAAPPAPAVLVVVDGTSVDGSGPDRILAVAAAGASGVPSLCRVPLRAPPDTAGATRWTLAPSGELFLGGGGGGDAGAGDPASGRHWLVFP